LAHTSGPAFARAAEHWFGFVAPAKTPSAVIKKLEVALGGALEQPAVQARFKELGLVLTRMVRPNSENFWRSKLRAGRPSMKPITFESITLKRHSHHAFQRSDHTTHAHESQLNWTPDR
jgi:hypothetical protein